MDIIKFKYPFADKKDYHLKKEPGKVSFIAKWSVKDTKGNPIAKPTKVQYLQMKQDFRAWRLNEKEKLINVKKSLKLKLNILGLTNDEIKLLFER